MLHNLNITKKEIKNGGVLLEVGMVTCPVCGKETFNRKFCIFCGKSLETQQDHTNDITSDVDQVSEKDSLGNLQKKLEKLEKLKDRFEKGMKDLENDCRQIRSGLEEDIARFENEKDDAKKSLDELDVLHSLEEISENEYNKKSDALNQRIKQREKEIKDAKSQINELKKLSKNFSKSVTTTHTKKPKTRNKKRTREKIAKLEIAYKEGKIGKELFEKLKAKYEIEVKK
jgi:DNA repair exonuclease SbcCD ATPase subunit